MRHFRFLGIDYYQILLMTFLLGSLCGIAFLASGRRRDAVMRFCPPWLYGILLVGSLFLVRLPTFLPGSLNVDEAMFLAGAMKLRHYPVFWGSLEGATSGPLNYYALTLINLLGLPLDYATARLLNVICVGGAIAVVYGVARRLMSDWSARLTPLPALAAVMSFRGADFLHYSSECVSVLMIATATWLLFADHLSAHASWPRGLGIGALAAFLPLAKLQAAPIALIIAMGGLAQGFFGNQPEKWRRSLYGLTGLAAGGVSLGLFLIVFGVFNPFWQSYLVMNFLQANMYPPVSLQTFLQYCFAMDTSWYEAGMLAWLVYLFVSLYFPWRRREAYRLAANQFIGAWIAATVLYYAGAWWLSRIPDFTLGPVLPSLLAGFTVGLIWTVLRYSNIVLKFCFLDVFVFSLLACTLYAVDRPRAGYPHYLLFLVFPVALVGARTFGRSLERIKNTDGDGRSVACLRTASLFVLLTLALPFFGRSKELRPMFQSEAWMLRARLKCAPCQVMNRFAKPGDLVTVWGWAPELYVQSGTLPATREPQTPYQMTMGGPLQGYYRQRFMEDLRLHPPKLFVDAVGPGQFRYEDRDANGYETFPRLREYVDRNFYLVGDVDGVRVFARKDTAGGITAPDNQTPTQ